MSSANLKWFPVPFFFVSAHNREEKKIRKRNTTHCLCMTCSSCRENPPPTAQTQMKNRSWLTPTGREIQEETGETLHLLSGFWLECCIWNTESEFKSDEDDKKKKHVEPQSTMWHRCPAVIPHSGSQSPSFWVPLRHQSLRYGHLIQSSFHCSSPPVLSVHRLQCRAALNHFFITSI